MTFREYYKKNLEALKNNAKHADRTIKSYLSIIYKVSSLKQFKEYIKKQWNRKECRSFWKSECENRDIECYRCCFYLSDKEMKKKNFKHPGR